MFNDQPEQNCIAILQYLIRQLLALILDKQKNTNRILFFYYYFYFHIIMIVEYLTISHNWVTCSDVVEVK